MNSFRKLFSVNAHTEYGGSAQFAVISVNMETKVRDINLQTREFAPLSHSQSELLFDCMLGNQMVDLIVEHATDEQRIFILSEYGIVVVEEKGIVGEMKGLILEGILSGRFFPKETKVSHRDLLKRNDMIIVAVNVCAN